MNISEVTRRSIFDELRLKKVRWYGDLEEIQFLERLFDLNTLHSNDNRCTTARGDIYQHRVAYGNKDWDDHWVYDDDRFNLRRGANEVFLNFICEIVHPVVRANQDEVTDLVRLFNKYLANNGWEIVEKIHISGKPVFAAHQLVELPVNTPQKIAQTLNTSYIIQQINRMQTTIESEPDLAIGTAKEFLETVCKAILDKRCDSYDKDMEFPKLVRLTCKKLKLVREDVPNESAAADTIRNLLSNLATISNSLAELRNRHGTGHGKDPYFKGLQPRHARLAVGAASTLGVFLFETDLETP